MDLDADIYEADRDIIAEAFLADEPYTIVETLVDQYGSRFGGTEGERGAAEWLQRRMESYGLEAARREEFTYTGWVRGDSTLTITAPINEELDCIGLPHSPSADVEAEVIYLGYATPGMFEARLQDISGKLVLADAKSPLYLGRGIHRGEKYRRAVAAGAVGFIWMRDVGGHLAETGGLFTDAPIPGIGVSRETGHKLVRLAEQGTVKARLRTNHESREFSSWNVVGDLRGTAEPEKVMVVGAHFDGHDIAEGALDDASGAAVVMEAARLLARHRELLRRTVRFVCFPVEEIGLYGSRAYVAQHEDELSNHLFMLNLDGARRPTGTKGLALQSWPDLIP
jgi:Zn-dependent M28 family amino/carboxypeptidase